MFISPSVLYTLAHVVIPQRAQRDPVEFYQAMALDRPAYVAWLVEQVGFSGPADDSLPPITITAACCSTGLYPAVLFVFDRPSRATEPFMAAVVAERLPEPVHVDLEADTFVEPPAVKPRYFLLEATAPDQGHANQLCEWQGRVHLNHGPGPEPSVQGFFEAIHRLMRDPA